MKILKKQGINFHMQHKVEKLKRITTMQQSRPLSKEGTKKDFECDVVLISVGQKTKY